VAINDTETYLCFIRRYGQKFGTGKLHNQQTYDVIILEVAIKDYNVQEWINGSDI
jgi:hypothetical protein